MVVAARAADGVAGIGDPGNPAALSLGRDRRLAQHPADCGHRGSHLGHKVGLVDPADEEKPKLQRAHVYFEQPL